MKQRMPLCLGSASPRRYDMLNASGLSFVMRHPNVDERQRRGERPLDYVERVARDKGRVVVSQIVADSEREPMPHAWVVLSADTIVVCDERIMGKPADEADHRAMLLALSGKKHEVITSVYAARTDSEQIASVSVTTELWMSSYGEELVDRYIASADGQGKAGGYAIQEGGAVLVDRVAGSLTNVIGLPLKETLNVLSEIGALA